MTVNGLWCDVVAQAGQFLLISTQGDSSVTATREDGTRAWRCPTPEPLWYLRAAALPSGAICVIGNGHTTGALQVVIAQPDGTVRASSVTGLVSWGQCVEAAGDHWLAAVQLSPRTWQMLAIYADGGIEPGPVQPIPTWPGGDGSTSQGFLQMIDGAPVWSDPNRALAIDGRVLLLPVRAGDAACGQTEDGVWWAKPGYATRAIPGNAVWPRMAQAGDRYAVCAWTYPDINTMTIIAPPYPVNQGVVLPPVPAALKGRALWLGYYFALSDRPGYGDNLAAPGNCTVVLTQPEADRSPWPYFAPVGIGDGPRKIAHLLSLARGESLPVDVPSHTLVVYDGGNVLPPAPCGLLTGLECYCDPGQPMAEIEANLRAWLTRYPTARVILIGQGYTRNGQEPDRQKLANLQALPLRLAVDFPQVDGVIYFSDGRATGTRDNEWWRPVHRDAAALVVTPGGPMPPTPTPEPPAPEPPSGDLAARVARLEAVLPIYGQRIRNLEAAVKAAGAAMP